MEDKFLKNDSNLENAKEEQRIGLLKMAKRILDEEEVEEIEKFLYADEPEKAKIILLGAIDRIWDDKDITETEAKEFYDMLNIDQSKREELRQSVSKPSFKAPSSNLNLN